MIFSDWLFKVYRRPLQFLAVVVVLPLAVIVAATHQGSHSMARDQALQNLRMTAQVAAEAVDATLNEAFLFARIVTEDPVFMEALKDRNEARLKAVLVRTLPFLADADQAIVADPEGRILASTSDDSPRASIADEEGFRAAKENGWQPYVSAVRLRNQESFEKVVDVVLPVLRDGVLHGLLKIEYRVESVRLWVQRIRVEPEGFIYVTDHKNQLVVFPFQVLPGKPKVVADWPPVAQPLSSGGVALVFRDGRIGRQWLAGVFPIGETGWRVVAVQPNDAVLRVLYRIFLPMGSLVLILLLMVMFVSLRWAQLQELNFRLLKQNAKLLKQSQQRWTLEQGKSGRQGGTST